MHIARGSFGHGRPTVLASTATSSPSGAGGLSEHHMPGAMLGETFGLIIAHQFEALRDGDQFYYEKTLDPAEVAMVKNTSLSDIIERDTDTDVMQADAFLTAERHASNVAPEDPNAPQLVIGTAGFANIRGGAADDTLVANNGASLMFGDRGNDTFVFEFGKKTIAIVRDFHVGSDTLEIHGVNPATDFADVQVRSNPAGTTVDIGQDHIQLLGVSHVSASDFLFHCLNAHKGRAGQWERGPHHTVRNYAARRRWTVEIIWLTEAWAA